MTTKKCRLLLSLSTFVFAFSFAIAQDVHPGLKNAIDNGDYKMAKNLVEKVGVTDVYCPASLNIKDAEKIYKKRKISQKELEFFGSSADGWEIVEACIAQPYACLISKYHFEKEFMDKFAEKHCTSSKKESIEFCKKWMENASQDRVTTLIRDWHKSGRNLCQNKETMAICERLIILSNSDERLEIFEQLDRKGLLKKEPVVVEYDTIVNETISPSECLSNLKQNENILKASIGAKSSGLWEFPFGVCRLDGTRTKLNECLSKLSKAIKIAERDCRKVKRTRNITKRKKKTEYITPFAPFMRGGLLSLLAGKWYDMDEIWWKKYNQFSKYLGKQDKADIIDSLRQNYNSTGDFDITSLVRYCKIYPSLDKDIAKKFGFKVFSCNQVIQNYQPAGSKCDASASSWLLKAPTMLNGKDSSSVLVCDSKTGTFRKPDKFEVITQEICEKPDTSWLKLYHVGKDSIAIVCDKDIGTFRQATVTETNGGLCTKSNEKKEYLMSTCLNGKWENTKKANVNQLEFEKGRFSNGLINPNHQYFKDFRDGEIYRAVAIGEQIWMAENLNYADSLDNPNTTSESWCYNNDSTFCQIFGRLYTWSAAMDSVGTFSSNGKGCGNGDTCSPTFPVRGICPEGWHIPTNSEWDTLYKAMGSLPYAMLAKGFSFSNRWTSATDTYGFSVLPTGHYYNGNFVGGGSVYFWTASEHHSNAAYGWFLEMRDAGLSGFSKHFGFAVRCLKDSP